MTVTGLHIAMISVHSSPLGPLGTQDTGGMSVFIRELAGELGRMGHRVDIFTGAGERTDAPQRRLHPHVSLIRIPLAASRSSLKSGLHAHLAPFARALDEHRRRTRADYDLIHSHYWLSGRVGEDVRAGWGAPHVITFHTLGAVKDAFLGPGPDSAVRSAAERRLAADCDRVLVASRREKGNLVDVCGADPSRVRVVPCGVDPAVFRPLDRRAARRRIGVNADARVVLYVGRFAPEKGLERALRAFMRLRSDAGLRLIVVGGEGDRDPQLQRMHTLAAEGGVGEQVVFTGRVEHDELPWFYSAADVLAVPSDYESFGMVALEALACGTPVAATQVGAMDELIIPDRNGCLASGFAPRPLADAIARALALPQAGSDLRREEIRRTVLRYGWPQVARDVLRVYQETLPVRPGIPGAEFAETPLTMPAGG